VQIDESIVGDFLVLRPAGRLDNATSPDFQARLLSAVAGPCDVIIDFTGIEYISSGGLRALILAAKQKPANRHIAVAGLRPVVQEIFAIAHFQDVVLPIFATVEEARQNLGGPSRPDKPRSAGGATEDGRRSRRS
jgi:anti-anti-sigma factor